MNLSFIKNSKYKQLQRWIKFSTKQKEWLVKQCNRDMGLFNWWAKIESPLKSSCKWHMHSRSQLRLHSSLDVDRKILSLIIFGIEQAALTVALSREWNS